MGFIVFLILAGLEIVLAVLTCTKGKEKSVFCKNRVLIHAVQVLAAGIAFLLPFGQRWRFVPGLGFLLILLAVSALVLLIRGEKVHGIKKPAGAVVSCVLCIIAIGIFLLPAFLFTGYKGLPVSGKYQIGETSAILIDRSRTDPFETDGSFREVPVHFYYPEDMENDTGKFPLLVFSHGAFGFYQSNTSTYMELASNGYVVAALDHPHHAFFAEDTDGKMVLVDQGFLNTALQMSGEPMDGNAEKQLDIYREWMDLRTADMGFVLDELKRAGQEKAINDNWFLTGNAGDTISAILNRADLTSIGLMGHSMGGATSIALGRQRDDIAAVIDIDGTMLSEYTGVEDGMLTVNEQPYEVPVLEFVNWDTYNELAAGMEEYRAKGRRYPNDELMQHAAAGFSTTIRDTRHMDFTDLPLLSPFLGDLLGSGERDNAETMTIVNRLILQFYDCYLKGEGTFTAEDTY
ncbi:MAG: hypothetical protein IJJ25_03275 [Lachnospiraceae bacterium]|nr:hypothetical protein [Lachnospiraceae bacterium]